MTVLFSCASSQRARQRHPVTIMDRRLRLAADLPGTPAHCSSPPLQAAFRLPRMPRDVEAITRPRAPLRPVKWEEASETDAVVEFDIGRLDEVIVKVEAEEAAEAPVEAKSEREVRVQMSALRVAPPAPAPTIRRAPGRPKGSASKPRVEPMFDTSAPPEREKAREARARIAGEVKRRR